MYTVKLFCSVCGSELEIVDEFKEGTKKDWLVNPCECCKTHGAGTADLVCGCPIFQPDPLFTTVQCLICGKPPRNPVWR